MANIYEQHDKAFARTGAWIIARDGERVATVAIRYPADGAGRLYAYVHWLGTHMVRGHASGYGYDKATAACAHAMRNASDGMDASFREAMASDGGWHWHQALERAGFTVWQAV